MAVPYAVPVYVGGGFYDNPYLGDGGAGSVPPQSAQQPNVVVVYPPMQQPVAMTQFGAGDSSASAPVTQPAAEEAAPEPEHYLIAFKDRTIYAAVAFWVQGDTLHYFTSGNTHNQVSLSLIDKDLTQRLNKESGVEMRLP